MAIAHYYQSRFYHIINMSDISQLKRLVDEEKADVNEQWDDKVLFSPLSLAVSFKWFEGVQYLVASKANVNQCSNDGWSILHESAFIGDNGKITRFLLEHGADPNFIGYEGLRAVNIAANNRSVDSLRELCRVTKNFNKQSGPNGYSPLASTIIFCHPLAAAVLLDAGAKLESLNMMVYPDWFQELVTQRKNFKMSLIAFYACIYPLIHKDMAKKVIEEMWKTRDFEEWE